MNISFLLHLDKYVGVGFLGWMLSFSFPFVNKNFQEAAKLPPKVTVLPAMTASSCFYFESKSIGDQPH